VLLPTGVQQARCPCPRLSAHVPAHTHTRTHARYLHYEDDWYILASKPDSYVVRPVKSVSPGS
jgi:hypothetical protein